MSAVIAPRKTEYKGVCLKSKSEALFIRAMEKYFGSSLQWVYEPSYLTTKSGWCPDFHCFSVNDNQLSNFIIEYKPSETTDTYCTELISRFMEVEKNISGYPEPLFMLIECSPYKDVSKSSAYILNGDYLDCTDKRYFIEKIHSLMESAKSYRFDLA